VGSGGITVVAGDQTLDKTARNTLQVLTVAGRTDVPVYAGMDRPMVRELVTAEHVHGESGLEGPVLPEPGTPPREGHAVDWLSQHLRHAAEPVEIVATGPLTNLGLLLRREPAVAENIARLVIMGGAVGEGNITPSAEFNVFVDPEAAAIVLRPSPACGVLRSGDRRAAKTYSSLDR
jgi:pyrimidine-specific ribonucleoside hydrolase